MKPVITTPANDTDLTNDSVHLAALRQTMQIADSLATLRLRLRVCVFPPKDEAPLSAKELATAITVQADQLQLHVRELRHNVGALKAVSMLADNHLTDRIE